MKSINSSAFDAWCGLNSAKKLGCCAVRGRIAQATVRTAGQSEKQANKGGTTMKKTAGMLWAAVSAFAFAAPSVDKDGVPVVDIHGKIIQITDANTLAAAKNSRFRPIQRRRMIAVGDKQIPLGEFLRTYCYGKMQNETCARGISISRIDSTFGLMESLPKGL